MEQSRPCAILNERHFNHQTRDISITRRETFQSRNESQEVQQQNLATIQEASRRLRLVHQDAMSLQNRTQEFLAAVESYRQSSVHAPLIQHTPLKSRSEFTNAASHISKEINSTMQKLQKLTTLAKKKSLFEDRPVEINELIYIIKQDIAKINTQIGQLSDYLSKQNSQHTVSNKQTKEHSHHVITSLQSKLATTSDAFKDVLQVRFENMKQQKTRRDEYSFSDKGQSTAVSESALYNPEKRNTPGETVIDFGSSFQQQQVALETANMEYIESRSQAIESIESTIAELGQIYQNFATILAGQREMVQRIDDNIMDVSVNVEGAHSQLVQYYQNMSSNRGLILKVFGIMLVFFLLFVLAT